jgi:hypothetical protein
MAWDREGLGTHGPGINIYQRSEKLLSEDAASVDYVEIQAAQTSR